MVNFLQGVGLTLIFWFGMEFFWIRGKKILNFYFVLFPTVTLLYRGYGVIGSHWLELVVEIICQIVIVTFLVSLKKSMNESLKMKIYCQIYQSPFIILGTSGLWKIEEQECNQIILELKKILFVGGRFKKHNFLTVKYKENSLEARFTFFNINDYQNFRREVSLREEYIEKCEEKQGMTGALIDYIIPIAVK